MAYRILELAVLYHQRTHVLYKLDHPLEELFRVIDTLGHLLEDADKVNDVWPAHLINLSQ